VLKRLGKRIIDSYIVLKTYKAPTRYKFVDKIYMNMGQ
jgi:hypothetical protein